MHVEAPAEEYVPAEHGLHDRTFLAPPVGLCLPARHVVHDVALCWAAYVPGWHGVQAPAPDLLCPFVLIEPGRQNGGSGHCGSMGTSEEDGVVLWGLIDWIVTTSS